jgi:hypothetical protein
MWKRNHNAEEGCCASIEGNFLKTSVDISTIIEKRETMEKGAQFFDERDTQTVGKYIQQEYT